MKKVEKEITIDDFDINTCKLEDIEIAQDVTQNGNIVYFDVLKGKGCTVNEYHPDNSKTEYNGIDKSTDTQANCLKFYAFNYKDGDDKVNLLLDHNTTRLISWNHGSNNKLGPLIALSSLKKSTNLWNGTLTPANYKVNYESGEYTIEYDNIDDALDYKARLITADEIAEITGANKDIQLEFNSTTSNQENWFYFDTNSQIESETCTKGTWNSETNEYENSNLTECKYDWLYDRTSTSCTSYGCEYNSDAETFGYWTANYTYGTEKNAWNVHFEGSLINSPLWDECDYAGVRPVIEVLVSDL